MVPADATICSSSKVTLDKPNLGPNGQTTQHRLVAEQLGKTTLTDTLGKRKIDVYVLTPESLRMEEERERKAALVQAKLQAKWWGKTNTEALEEDEIESKDP